VAEFGEARDDGAASAEPVRGGPGADCGFQLKVSVQCEPTLVTREFTLMRFCNRGSSSNTDIPLLNRVDTRWLHSENRVLKLSGSMVPGRNL